MYACYVDESGDTGYAHSPSRTFALAFVLVPQQSVQVVRENYARFRHYLQANFNIPSEWPLRVHQLIHRKGPFAALLLSKSARINVFRAVMRFQRKCNHLKTYSIVIDKARMGDSSSHPRMLAWIYAVEWLDRLGKRDGRHVQMFYDEGNHLFGFYVVQRVHWFGHLPLLHKGRIYHHALTGEMIVPEYSVAGHDEIFVQIADFNAYAACRVIDPTELIDSSMWEQLGDARIADENSHLKGLRIVP